MTREPETVPDAGAHPDPGQIAAHVEKRLTGAEADRMDEHLARCSICHEVFAETLRFGLDEEAEEALPGRAADVLPFVRRKAFRLAAVLAVAASVLLAFQQLWLTRSGRPAAPLVAELVRALGTTRFVEPRLTGGFQHGRVVVLRSDDRPAGLDAYSPDVLAAVAGIRERALGDTSPEALGALAVSYLVSGDVDRAVKALESATAQDPQNPRLQSDLAAAYLVRASRLDEPADIPKALEAAEKSIESPDAPPEAWFNRALALEQLHLVESAKKAWQDFLDRDSTSPWADEARRHIEELPPAQQSTIEEDRARAGQALAEGPAAIDALAEQAPPILADYFLAELLPAWSDAYLDGHPSAGALRARAELVGDALFRTTGDALHRDAAHALSLPRAGGARDPPRLQAQGYKALQEAQRILDRGQPSCDAFRESRRLLESGGSPYAAWSRERIVVTCLYLSDATAAVSELHRIETLAARLGHLHLFGRAHSLLGLLHGRSGQLTAALDEYGVARDAFRTLRDAQGESKMLALIAEGLLLLGDVRGAWRERIRGMALLDRVRVPSQRQGMLSAAAIACLEEGRPRAALRAGTAALDAARGWGDAAAVTDALIWRIGILTALGSHEAALTDLLEARRWISKIAEPAVATQLAASADAEEGRILVAREPERATAALERAIQHQERTTSVLVPDLRLLLARALIAQAATAEAEDQLDQAIALVERQRSSLRGGSLQASFFEQSGSLFDEMVRLQVDERNDPRRGLAFVERARARQLLESLSPPVAPASEGGDPPGGVGAAPLSPEDLQGQLPDGVVLVYYVCLPERVLSWVLSREDLRLVERRLPREALERLVAAYEAAMKAPATAANVRQVSGRLFDELVRPLLPVLPPRVAVIVIPDGPLQGISFAGLWNRETVRYLVEDHLVAVAPSGTVFARACVKASAESLELAPRLLVVGNPSLDRDLSRELPSLPGAEAEAAEVAELYRAPEVLTRGSATKGAFLAALRHSQVVHLAVHAAVGDGPGAESLLLASDADTARRGTLYGYEIDQADVARARVVVLAGCRTAVGTASRLEGTLGLARYFLAAGAPSVVASLWDVDDMATRRFSVAFHRSLLARREPAVALRQAQLALLHGADPLLAHPASWAGFVALGGLDPVLTAHPSQPDSDL